MERKITLVVLMATIISIGLPSIPQAASLTCIIPPSGLISWWPLDETSGTTAVDIKNGNDGTHNNGPTPVAGKVGGALSFNGFNQNVEIPDSPSLNPTNEITLDAWVFTTGGNNDIISKDGEGFDRQYLLTGRAGGTFRPHISTTTGFSFFDGSIVIQPNTWTHVAMTYDGSFLKLYVDGVFDGSISKTGNIITTTQPVRIGGGAPVGFNQLHWSGLIDEVEIFDRALTQPEIQSIVDADSDGKCKTLTCGAGTIQVGVECTPNLNEICGEGTFISGLQCLGLGLQAIGGIFVEIDALAVLGAAVGVDPLITGLVVITMLGITGQAAWFIHRRKKKSNL